MLQKDRNNDINQVKELKKEIGMLNNKITESAHIQNLLNERNAAKELIIEEHVKTISDLELKVATSLKANEEVEKRKVHYDFEEISFQANTCAILNDSLKQNVSQLQNLLNKTNIDKKNMEDNIKELKFDQNQKNLRINSLELENLQISNAITMKSSQYDITKNEIDKITKEKNSIESLYIEVKLRYEADIEKSSNFAKESEENAQTIKNIIKARDEVAFQFQEAEKRFNIFILINLKPLN